MTDEALIFQGKQAVAKIAQYQLELGRLALRFAPIGPKGNDVGTNARIKLYADKIGMDERTLRMYRLTAHAWRDYSVDDVPFSLVRALTPASDKSQAVELLRSGESWTKESIKAKAISVGLMSKPKPRKVTPLKNLNKVLEDLRTFNPDDFDRTKDKDTIKALGLIAKEVQRLQRAVEKKPKANKEPVAA